LYEEFFEYKPQFKIWLATNYKPIIRGNDHAIWRRIRLIPFSQQFDGNNADRLLLEKLEAELDGILAWAVEGCLAWQKSGLGKAVAVQAATQEYRRESDQFGRFFGERCVRSKQSQTQGKAFYEAYVQWCMRTSEKAASNPVFAAALAERGISKKRSRKGVVYQGVDLAALPTEKGQ
jgi:putative DNA primase/helicase